MRYSTCFNCAVDASTCQVRQRISRGIKGLGLQSIKFRCDARQPMFREGQRVLFNWSLWEPGDDEWGASELPLIFKGTVIREIKTKFAVQVDSGTDASGEDIEAKTVFKNGESLLIKVRPADMKALEEPDNRVCQTCFWAEGRSEPRCYANDGYSSPPAGCLEPPSVPAPAVPEWEF